MKKKIKDLTLEDIKNICSSMPNNTCQGCPLENICNQCYIGFPEDWKLKGEIEYECRKNDSRIRKNGIQSQRT